jgi:NADH:ubiquinone oxidoreductase subunit F (NADH-binding)
VIFEVVEDPEVAREKASKISYLSLDKVIDHGNCLSIQTVLSLQVDRVVIEEIEADDAYPRAHGQAGYRAARGWAFSLKNRRYSSRACSSPPVGIILTGCGIVS